MKKTCMLLMCLLPVALLASTPPRGTSRLCELAVFPKFDLTFKFGFTVKGGEVVLDCGEDPAGRISELRQALKRQPDDVPHLLMLGDLLNDINETNAAHNCYLQAEKICRERLGGSPQSGLLLVNLGQALQGLDKADEAEICCRKATQVAPKEWRCWAGLGELLFARMWKTLSPNLNLMSLLSAKGDTVSGLLKNPPSAGTLQKAIALDREAAQCYDQAVALAPDEPDAYLRRSGFKMISCLANLFIQYFRDATVFDEKKPVSYYLFTKSVIPDLNRAAQLSARNPDIIGMAVGFEWITTTVESGSTKPNLEALPAGTRRSILDGMTRLDNLTHDPDKQVAASAARFLGIVKILSGSLEESGFSAAEPYFRRAIVLEPDSDAAWDLLFAALVSRSAPPNELVDAAESRLKAKDSTRNHLLMAKAFAVQKNWAKCAGEAAVAAKQDTNNVIAPLMLAAASIRQGEKPGALPQTVICLRAARERLQIMPAGEERDKRMVELMLNAALYHALNGQTKEARELVEAVLKHVPDSESAQQIKEALPDA